MLGGGNSNFHFRHLIFFWITIIRAVRLSLSKSATKACNIYKTNIRVLLFLNFCRSQWPRGLRRGSAAARLMRLWGRIPPGICMSVSCDCCVLSDRGLCAGPITRPEESYPVVCLNECDCEASIMRRPWST